MAVTRELNERMTVNIQGWKKEELQNIAMNDRISDSKLLLKIVDEWLERRNASSASPD